MVNIRGKTSEDGKPQPWQESRGMAPPPEKPPQKSPMTWCKPSSRPVRHSGVGITPPPSEDTSSRSAKTNAWRQITDLQPSTAHDHWSMVTISKSVTSWGHLPRVNQSDLNWSRTKLWRESTRQAKKTQDVLIETTSKSVKAWARSTRVRYFIIWKNGPEVNSMAQLVGRHATPPTSLRGSLSLEAIQLLTMAHVFFVSLSGLIRGILGDKPRVPFQIQICCHCFSCSGWHKPHFFLVG